MRFFLSIIKNLTKKKNVWLNIIQLTHKICHNKKLTNKNINKNITIPILITVFSVLYYLNYLQVLTVLHLIKIYTYNKFLLMYKKISHLFIVKRKYIFFENLENIYYSNISTDRNTLYEKGLKLLISEDFKYYPNMFLFIYDLTNNILNSYNDNLLELLNTIIVLLSIFMYLILIFKIKHYFLIVLLYFSILALPLILYVVGIDLYFYDYNYIYSMFKIVESFLNRNVYIDSNYFLTSDSLRGIEKFTDISVPWLVDYEDSGWGGDFDIQNQIDVWKEREHKFITEDIDLVYSPYLEYSETSEGSFFSRFIKIKQRLAYWINTLSIFSEIDSKIWLSWELKNLLNYKNSTKLNNSFIFNFFEFSNLKVSNPNGFLVGDIKKSSKQVKKYWYSNLKNMSNFSNFYLPKKNNITNENFNQSQTILDRKQVVYRNLNNNIDGVEKIGNVKYRRPDLTLDTNYIFERQLQSLRVNEYNIKEKLYKYFELKWKMYYSGKNYIIKKKSLIEPNKKILASGYTNSLEKIASKIKYWDSRNKNINLPNYSILELKLENIVKFWNSNTIENSRSLPRNYEFVYLRQNQKFINCFNEAYNQVQDTFEFLVKNNKIGLGSYTYSGVENIPWSLESNEMFELFNKVAVSLISKDKLSYWLAGKNKLIYNDIILWIDKYFYGLDMNIKKHFFLLFTKRFVKTWIYTDNIKNNYNFEYIYLLIFFEFLLENIKNAEILNSISTAYISILSNLGISELKISNNWKNLVNLRLRGIGIDKNIIGRYSKISERAGNINKNYTITNKKQIIWKNYFNYSILKSLLINKRILLNKISDSISINEQLDSSGYLLKFNFKNFWKQNLNGAGAIENNTNKDFLNVNYQVRSENTIFNIGIFKKNKNNDRIKDLDIELIFFENNFNVLFFNYLNYFFFGYKNIFLKKLFIIGQSFKNSNKNKNTKYCFLMSFKILELPIPVFVKPLKYNWINDNKVFSIKFWYFLTHKLSTDIYLKIKDILKIDYMLNHIFIYLNIFRFANLLRQYENGDKKNLLINFKIYLYNLLIFFKKIKFTKWIYYDNIIIVDVMFRVNLIYENIKKFTKIYIVVWSKNNFYLIKKKKIVCGLLYEFGYYFYILNKKFPKLELYYILYDYLYFEFFKCYRKNKNCSIDNFYFFNLITNLKKILKKKYSEFFDTIIYLFLEDIKYLFLKKINLNKIQSENGENYLFRTYWKTLDHLKIMITYYKGFLIKLVSFYFYLINFINSKLFSSSHYSLWFLLNYEPFFEFEISFFSWLSKIIFCKKIINKDILLYKNINFIVLDNLKYYKKIYLKQSSIFNSKYKNIKIIIWLWSCYCNFIKIYLKDTQLQVNSQVRLKSYELKQKIVKIMIFNPNPIFSITKLYNLFFVFIWINCLISHNLDKFEKYKFILKIIDFILIKLYEIKNLAFYIILNYTQLNFIYFEKYSNIFILNTRYWTFSRNFLTLISDSKINTNSKKKYKILSYKLEKIVLNSQDKLGCNKMSFLIIKKYIKNKYKINYKLTYSNYWKSNKLLLKKNFNYLSIFNGVSVKYIINKDKLLDFQKNNLKNIFNCKLYFIKSFVMFLKFNDYSYLKFLGLSNFGKNCIFQYIVINLKKSFEYGYVNKYPKVSLFEEIQNKLEKKKYNKIKILSESILNLKNNSNYSDSNPNYISFSNIFDKMYYLKNKNKNRISKFGLKYIKKINLEINLKKLKFNLVHHVHKNFFFLNKYYLYINIKKLKKLKDNFIESLLKDDVFKSLNALKFIGLVKIWTNYVFQNIFEKIKIKKIGVDLYYLWYDYNLFNLKKIFLFKKKLNIKLKKINIIEIVEIYGKKYDYRKNKLKKDWVLILNSLINKNNNTGKKISESIKLLEFFNFSNFSEYYDIEKDELIYNDFEKKKINKIVSPHNEKSIKNKTHIKKINLNDNKKLDLKKKYVNIDLNNYYLYLKFEYMFKYINYSRFLTTKINLKNNYKLYGNEKFKIYEDYFYYIRKKLQKYKNFKIKIKYFEQNTKDNSYFDTKKKYSLNSYLENIVYRNLQSSKYLLYVNPQKLQIWDKYSICFEVLEYFFEPRRYTVISTLSKEKKLVFSFVSEHYRKKSKLESSILLKNYNNYYFGELRYSFLVVNWIWSYLIYEKKKMIFETLIGFYNFENKIILSLERQKILSYNFFELLLYFDMLLVRKTNILIDLVVLKVKVFIFIYKYFTLFMANFYHISLYFYNDIICMFLNNNIILVYVIDKIIVFYNLIFCTFLIYTDFYFIKINYEITEHPFFYEDIRNVDTGVWFFRNNFDFYYYTFKYNFRLFNEAYVNYNFYIYLEYINRNISFIKNYFYLSFIGELDNSETIQGRENFTYTLLLFDELKDIGFQKIYLGFQSYLENRGQLFWLDVCIFFDYIFELFVTFDFEYESSPFFRAIWHIIEMFRKILTVSPFSGYQFTGLDAEMRSSLLKYYNKTGSDSQVSTDFNIHGHNDVYFDENELIEENSKLVELGHFNGIDQLDEVSVFDFLGWGYNSSVGTNPGNEFSSINDFLEIPQNLEKYFNFDISDWYHRVFGLDGPKLGELYPSFDISLPIKSFWLIGIIYYEPKVGGLLMVDFYSLISFFIVLFLDRRTSFYIKIYNIIDLNYFQITNYNIILLKLKVTYFLHDIYQLFEVIYINPADYFEFLMFYIIYLINYFGVLFPVCLYIIFIILGKINIIFEKKNRKYGYSDYLVFNILSQFYNYLLFRFIYLFISNSYIFLRMTVSIIIVLTILYIFSEGLHIFSILRLFSFDHEGSKYINGLYFLIERDPFVEKYNLNDEVWDQFKYDSNIDDEWSRIHYHREHAEIFGGTNREQSVLIDSVGYSKKHNIEYNIHDRGVDIETTPAKKSKSIIDQIHNRIPDEGSFMPRFIVDSDLEREFFRENEMLGKGVEGSLDWFSRSDDSLAGMWTNDNFSTYYYKKALFDRSRFKSNKYLMQNNLYAALLMNFYDPKWVWDDGLILSERINKPIMFSHNKKELYNKVGENSVENYLIFRNIIADNRIAGLIKKNKGITQKSPILDFWDEDPYTDIGLEIQGDTGSSIGSQQNQISTWSISNSDILTQKIRRSLEPSISNGIFFNYITNDDEIPINFYNSENLILENFIETLFNTSSPNTRNIHFPTEVRKSKFQRMRRVNKRLDTYDVHFKRRGRYPTLEDNTINTLFPKNDFLITDDLDFFTGVFIDLNNYKKLKELVNIPNYTKNVQNISLENLRRRDLQYKKLDGNDPVSFFYDEMISEDIEKEIYRNLDNISGIAPRSFSSYYKNNEFVTKSNTNKKSIWTKAWDLQQMRTRAEKKDSAIHELSDDNLSYSYLKEYPTKLKRLKFENYLIKIRMKKKEKALNSYIFNKKIVGISKNNNIGFSDNSLNGKLDKKNNIYNNPKNWNNEISYAYGNWLNNQKYFSPLFVSPSNYKYIKYLIKKEVDTFQSIYTNFIKKKDIIINYEKKNSLLNNFSNIYKVFYIIEKNKKKYDLSKTYQTIDNINNLVYDTNFDRKKISLSNNYNYATILKNLQKNKINTTDELYFIFKNYDNIINSNLYSKIKNKLLKKKSKFKSKFNYNVFKECYSKIKKPIWYNIIKNNKIKENSNLNKTFTSFSNDIYSKKINEYISKRGGQKYINRTNKIKKSKEKLSIFFGDKWYLDNNLRLGYNLINWKNNDFEIWESLANLKNKNKKYKESYYDKIRIADDKHSYSENRGYWATNSETGAMTDLRMHGINQIDHFASPTSQNDDETFSEYIELWNPNFGRLYNNLGYISKGNVMNLKTYWHDHLIIDPQQEHWESESGDDFSEYQNPEKILVGFNNKKIDGQPYPKAMLQFKNTVSMDYLKNLPKDTSISLIKYLTSNIYINKINWYDKSILNKIYKKKTPWGFELKNNYFWKGPQYFNLELISENLSPLFSKKYYERPSVSFNNLEKNKHNNKLIEIDIQGTSRNKYKIKKKNDYVYNFEKIDRGLSVLKDISDVKKIKNKKKVWSHYKKIPGNPFTIDISTDSQVKESFSDSQFEYGKNLISIKQHSLMQSYWDNNIPLQNRIITPKQGSDYFWYVYKKYKQNRVSKFWKKINVNKKNILNNSNITYLNWENKIKNPENKYKTKSTFNKFLNKKIKNTELHIIGLGNTWLSKKIYDRLYLKPNNYSLGLSTNIISDDVFSKNRLKKKSNFNVLLNKDTINQLKKIGIANNNLLNTNRYRFFNNKEKTGNFRESRDNFLFNTELSSRLGFKNIFIKKNFILGQFGVKKNNYIKNLVFKKKQQNFQYGTIFDIKKNILIKNQAVSSSLRDIYELPFSSTMAEINNSMSNSKGSIYEISKNKNKKQNQNGSQYNFNDSTILNNSIKNRSNIREISNEFNNNQKNDNYEEGKLPQYIDYQNKKIYENSNLFNERNYILPSDKINKFKKNKTNSLFNPKNIKMDKYLEDPSEIQTISDNSEIIFQNTDNSQTWHNLNNLLVNDLFNYNSNYYYGFNNSENKNNNNIEITSNSLGLRLQRNNEFGETSEYETSNESIDNTDSSLSNFDEMSDDSDNFDIDEDYYYNKKINTNLTSNVDFRTPGESKSVNFNLLNIYVENIDKNNENNKTFNYNKDPSNILYFENDNLVPNLIFYKNNKSILSGQRFTNWRFNKNFLLYNKKKKLKPNLGVSIFNYISSDTRVLSNNNLEIKDNEKLPFYDTHTIQKGDYFVDKNKVLKKKNIVILNGKISNLNYKKNINNLSNNYNQYYNKIYENRPYNINKIKLEIWKKQQPSFSFGGKISLGDKNNEQIKNKIVSLDKKLSGISKSYNFIVNVPFLNKTQKVENPLGSFRYKKIPTNYLYSKTKSVESVYYDNKNLFNFGLNFKNNSKPKRNLSVKSIHNYIQYKDNRKYSYKEIVGFYSDLNNSNKKIADNDYLEVVGIPVVKNFEKTIKYPRVDQYYIYNKDKINISRYEMGDYEKNVNNNNNQSIRLKTNKSIGSIFNTSHQFINSKNQKITSNTFKKFSAIETIKPLPLSRSLSVDSKLFSKISSLRIHGAGRLSDFIYKPKLKHLLKNQTNFYDLGNRDNISKEDEMFLLKMLKLEKKSKNKFNFSINKLDYKKSKKNIDTPKFFKNIDFLNFKYKWFGKFEENIKNIIKKKKIVNSVVKANVKSYYPNKVIRSKKKNKHQFITNSRYVDRNDNIPEIEKSAFLKSHVFSNNTIEKEKNRLLKNLILGSKNYENYYIQNAEILENIGMYSKNILNNFNKQRIDHTNFDNNDKVWNKYFNTFSKKINNNISKESWLFDIYKNIVTKDNTSLNKNYFYKNIIDSDHNDDDILENYNSEENLRLENYESFSNLNAILKKNESNSEYNYYENSENYFKTKKNLLNLENNLDLDNLDYQKNKILINITTDTEFSKNIDDFNNNYNKLDDFLSRNYNNLITPISKIEKSLSDSLIKYGNSISINSLDDRKYEVINNKRTYNWNNKIKITNSENKIDRKKLKDYSVDSKLNRSKNQLFVDWNLKRTYWSDDLFNFNLHDSNFNNFNNNKDSSVYSKISLISKTRSDILKQNISSYFIKNKKLKLNKIANLVENQAVINKNVSVDDYDLNNIFQMNESKYIWNLNQYNKNKKLVKINQRIPSEMLSQLEFKKTMKFMINQYLIKKNILNLTNPSETSKHNNKLFLRKINSIENSKSSRRKYKGLKKKYWYRLDILERYLSAIKINAKKANNILGNNNYKDIIKNNKKPIQTSFNSFILHNIVKNFNSYKNFKKFELSEQSLNNGLLLDVENYYNKINLKKNIKSYKILKNIKINENGQLEKSWNNKKNELKKVLNSINRSVKHKIKNELTFDLKNILENSLNIKNNNRITLNNFKNANQKLIQNNEYLTFKLRNLKKNSIKGHIFNKSFNNFRILNKNNINNKNKEYAIFSDIRSNISKLQSNKYGDNLLPIGLVATFLTKLKNINPYDYIDDGYKKVNYYKNIKNGKNSFNSTTVGNLNNLVQVRGKKSISKLNTIKYYKKSPIIDEFSIYHKNLIRPGLSLNNRFSKVHIDPFRQFSSKKTLIDRGIKYGLGSFVYKNSPVNRRSYDLAIRTFGPSIRTNSIIKGYGRFDDVLEFNKNTEDYSNNLEGLGYPTVFEQNKYNTQFEFIPVWGSDSSIYENKLVDYLWDIDLLDEEKPKSFNKWFYFKNLKDNSYGMSYTFKQLLMSFYGERRSDHSKIYEFPASHQRFVGTANQKWLESFGKFEDIENPEFEDNLQNNLLYTNKNIVESLADVKLTDYNFWDWETFYNSKLSNNKKRIKNKITRKLYFDKTKNVGPLGYEEGDSLYDNRLLNRGWFPEKEIWGWGARSQSSVGSDSSTLELLSDYKSSFNHELVDYTDKYKYETLKDLDWAGKGNNKIFDTIDDLVEGLGFEENVPFRPEIADKIWHKDEYNSRYVYDDFDFNNDNGIVEDDEYYDYSIYSDPDGFYYYKDRLFNTLGFSNYIFGTNSWERSKYLGNLDSSFVNGTSIALADNQLYDGLISDFSNYISEKFPPDPLNGYVLKEFPLPSDGLYKKNDYYDSKLPEFSDYVDDSVNYKYEKSRYRGGISIEESKERDSNFYMYETFKPKDEFSFSPKNATFQRFEPEWVINGEGWLGNTGSNLSPISENNVPINYKNMVDNVYTQPRGLHSFLVNDDLDWQGGMDSPYFSLSDFQKNRIIRGRDNDISNFPIKSGWNKVSTHIPDWYSSFWKHRLNYGEAAYQTLIKSWNFKTNKQMGGIGTEIGDSIPFSNILGDNPDFINFSNSTIYERDLWWRAIDSGSLSPKNKEELAFNVINESNEDFRDFILSYDFKLFGKNWVNPQNTKIPLKSFSFYGDSQINDFLGSQKIDTFENTISSEETKNNVYSEISYGTIKDSQINFDISNVFVSIQMRTIYYKLFEIGVNYYVGIFGFFKSNLFFLFYTLLNNYFYKIETTSYILKYILVKKKKVIPNHTQTWLIFYLYIPFIKIFKIVLNISYKLYLTIISFDSFYVLDNYNYKNNMIFELTYDLTININNSLYNINEVFFKKKILRYIFKILVFYISLSFIVILI